MISTNIDGTVPGSNTLVELLGLISNPEAYAKKLAELEKATSEYKAYVALMGPANEIEKLRAEAGLDREKAAAATEFAKKFSKTLMDEAKEDAAAIVVKAKEDAKGLRDEAKVVNAEAKKLKAALADALEDAKAAKLEADVKIAEAAAAAAEANTKAEELVKAIADLAAEKEAIAVRHKQFIESL